METERELLAYLAVVIGDDVPGVRVDPAQAGDLYVDTGFLADLAPGGFDHGRSTGATAVRADPVRMQIRSIPSAYINLFCANQFRLVRPSAAAPNGGSVCGYQDLREELTAR
jgi:hypothetical protein